MARKSHSLRLSQAVNLLESYVVAHHQGREVLFVTDMISRMNRRKGLSAKQRNWLDSLIEEGVPAPKGDTNLIAEIERLLKVPGTDHVHRQLQDFLSREKRGWDLSPKQIAFRTRLIDSARVIERDGPWIPSNEMKEKLQYCIAMVPSRSTMYWSTHAGEGRAVGNVDEWLRGDEIYVDEWSVTKTLHSFRAGLRELENPYVTIGAMVWGNRGKFRGEMGIITGPPFVGADAFVSYPVLIDGVSLSFQKGAITKRRPRERSPV